jgi:primary-amine oxidase
MRILSLLVALTIPTWAQSPSHPLDGLTTAEYWAVYDTLKAAGHVTADTMFASVLLHAPAKSAVLAWQPGQPVRREADVVLLRGDKSFSALVDISGKKVLKFDGLKGAQAPFLASELFGADEFIKKDPRVIEALGKRGITDVRTVRCVALPVAYQAIPEVEGFCAIRLKRVQLDTFPRTLCLHAPAFC